MSCFCCAVKILKNENEKKYIKKINKQTKPVQAKHQTFAHAQLRLASNTQTAQTAETGRKMIGRYNIEANLRANSRPDPSSRFKVTYALTFEE